MQKRKILVAAHRGTQGGNVIPNTCLAFQNALLHGADIVEMDAAMTKDGGFYAFHSGTEQQPGPACPPEAGAGPSAGSDHS